MAVQRLANRFHDTARGNVLIPSPHAIERMADGNLTADDVMDVLHNPTTRMKDKDHIDRWNLIGTAASGVRIKIVITTSTPPVLVTAFRYP